MALEIRIKRAEEYSTQQLAAEMLADAVGSAPEDIFFYRGENGQALDKPDPATLLQPQRGLCGLRCGRKGGRRGSGADPSGAPRLERALTAAERQWLTSLPQAERDEGFFRLWTLKESWIKCRGGG